MKREGEGFTTETEVWNYSCITQMDLWFTYFFRDEHSLILMEGNEDKLV